MSRFALTLAAVVVLALACNGDRTGPTDEPQFVPVAVVLDVSGVALIDQVVVEVTGPGIDPPLAFNLTISGGTASGTITLPVGSDRTIAISVYDTGGILTHEGSRTIDVVQGTNPTVPITLYPLAGDVPITAELGGLVLTVTPGTATLAVGETVQLQATVIDSLGNPVAATVLWATLNPGLATVDGTGLVTGVAVGDVQVSATYAGVGDVADLTITAASP